MKKIVNFFSHAAETALAQDLAQRLIDQLAPDLVAKKRKLMSVNKITRLLEQAYRQAEEHQQRHRLGFIKRAALANSFKWALLDHGYPDDFVEMATEGLVVTLSKASRTRKADASLS